MQVTGSDVDFPLGDDHYSNNINKVLGDIVIKDVPLQGADCVSRDWPAALKHHCIRTDVVAVVATG